MAWWDHEELKDPKHRSDRYIVSFPDEYTKDEVASAQRRLDKQKAQYERQDMSETGPVTVPDEAAGLYADNIRLARRVKELEEALGRIARMKQEPNDAMNRMALLAASAIARVALKDIEKHNDNR